YARVRISVYQLHARPRVQRAPGLPCALCFEWADTNSKTRAYLAAGSRSRIWNAVIASAAKQSISPRKERMDCFAALAMTITLRIYS
ncbi:unnamed protein product, partial [Phaeothamnion confervicola]